MTRREAWLSAALVAVVAAVVHIVAARVIVFPIPEDTSYYVAVAGNVLDGRGLVTDAIWSYATPPLTFPRPAFEVWLPLPTFLAAVPMAILGQTFAAAQWLPIVAGSILAVLAWRLAADVAEERGLPSGRARVLAIGTGLTAAVYLPLLLHGVLPDSTVLFGALALGACLLMTRLRRVPRGARVLDPRLLTLGVLLGAAALTRNEAIWLALAWAIVAWTTRTTRDVDGMPVALRRGQRLRLIVVPAVIAIAIVTPWLVRNALVFGSPLPGQALANALSNSGTDIFAWADPPTLARHLELGAAALIQLRIDGLAHDLLNVLLYLGVPLSVVGLLGLPWAVRDHAIRGDTLRALSLYAGITFLVSSLVFPVATTWGTFLHAAAPVHVLLLVSAFVALDSGIAWVGRRRGWTRPVAWLGALFAIGASVLFSVALLPSYGRASEETAARYEGIAPVLAAAGLPLDGSPVITDHPIWLADTQANPSLALPNEPPDSVLSLARAFPGTHTVLTFSDDLGRWSAGIETGAPGADCFDEVALPTASDPAIAEALADARAWRIVCR
jgi:hypothetical protein